MKYLLSLTITLFYVSVALAQHPGDRVASIKAKNVNAVDSRYLELNNDAPVIREDFMLNERMVDMVDVYVVDSIIEKRTQRHRVGPFGPIIRAFGYCWRSINMRRVKLVGTAHGDIRIPHKDLFTEFDVNWNIVPHFKKYQDDLQMGYDFQLKKNRFLKKQDKQGPPFVYDREDNSGKYHFHCELTPGRQYRVELNEKFYPCLLRKGLEQHHNFGEKGITLGLYGAIVADCNHDCHPEIHPYEWIWWRELNPYNDGQKTKRWMVGLFQEMSNRFKRWAKDPRTGGISIPFIFNANTAESTIHIDHLVFGLHAPERMEMLTGMPADAHDLDFSKMEVSVEGSDKKIIITTNHPLRYKGMKFWFDEVETDGEWLTGNLSFGLSVEDVHTFRVSFSED